MDFNMNITPDNLWYDIDLDKILSHFVRISKITVRMQAVLIADNFSADFIPHKTISLIPLFNVPLVEYALESLYHSGVEKVFLVVSRCIDQVKAFLLEAKEQY
uniref:CSON012908 protein n=1 Tax=Culicoides sonorensis TaxID=179676 RepID=A0A336KRA5_CULSO